MSDEELRHLERESQAHPQDGELGWRYARALERAGDRRSFLVEASRLARLGHADAKAATRDAVALTAPGLQRGRGRRCSPLREPWKTREGRVAVTGQASIVAATERVLYLVNDEALVAVDTVGLRELWRRRRIDHGPLALRGEDVVIAEGRELVLLDEATGSELARSRQLGRIHELFAEEDRSVACIGANDGRLWLLAGIDLGRSLGRARWKRIHPRDTTGTVHGTLDGVAFVGSMGLRLEDGVADEHSQRFIQQLKDHGDYYRLRTRHAAESDGWRIQIALTRETAQPAVDFTALEVQSPGSELRRLELPPLRLPQGGATFVTRSKWSIALAAPLGYVVTVPQLLGVGGGGQANFLNVLTVDLETARIRSDFSVPVDLHGHYHSVEGIALDGALLVVVTTPESCRLFRLEGTS
ncbi:MAG: hypothetical protein ACAI25_00145 [Planctomycetota bacterium]